MATHTITSLSARVRRRVRPLARRALVRIRNTPAPLALILAVATLLSLAWNVSLPAFQGPDEAGHFAYVQHLAETGNLPSVTNGGSADSSSETELLRTLNLQPLIGNLQGRPAWSDKDLELWNNVERALGPGSSSNGEGPNPLAKNPPLYYALMTIPYRVFISLPLLQRIFVMRLFSMLCYLATVLLTWLLAGEIFGPLRWKQTLAAGAVALEPQLSFLSAVINADNLLIALTTGFLLAAVRLVRRGPSMGRVLSASLLAAAAVLTHGRGLVTLPVLAVALVASAIRFRPTVGEMLRRGAMAAGTVGGAFVTYLALGRAAGSSALYGGQVTELNVTSFNIRQFLSSIYQFYFPKLPSLRPRVGPEYGYRQVFIDTFYGTFGSLEVNFGPRIYDLLQVCSALGLVALYTAVVTSWRAMLRAWPTVMVLLALLVTTVFFLHYVSYRALTGDGGSDPLIVGRYLLPMVSLFGLAIAFTLGRMPRRVGPLLGGAVLAAGVILSLAGIGITVVRFYA